MMPPDRWTDQLSAYLDGELDSETVAVLERHLEECDACREAVEDLRAIVAVAPAYVGSTPERDLWPAIAEGIDNEKELRFPTKASTVRRPGRFSLMGQMAAAIGLIGIGAGATWMVLRGPNSSGSADPASLTVVASQPNRAMLAAVAYQKAVDDLQQVLAEGRDRLDPETLRVIQENLQLIDRAIAESEAALAADPANIEMRTWISAHMRRKLDLLRRAASAVGGAVSAS